jgi:hypothetical protein
MLLENDADLNGKYLRKNPPLNVAEKYGRGEESRSLPATTARQLAY